jgi:predicted RNA-binding Zn-ribbon protein involved in translation (DUF1610 family)
VRRRRRAGQRTIGTRKVCMPISFQCPQCGKKLKAPESAVGKSSACPGCGGTVTCPEPIYDAEVVDMTLEQPGTSAGLDPHVNRDDDKPYGLVDQGPTAPARDNRRACPMCGEMIMAGAAKCRYCGEVFDPALKKVKGKNSKQYSEDSDLSGGEMAVAILCSGIGCIAGLVWMIQGRPKGMKMFGLSLLMGVVGYIVVVIIAAIGAVLNNGGGLGGP